MKAEIRTARARISEVLGNSIGTRFFRAAALGALLVGAATLFSSISQGEAGSQATSIETHQAAPAEVYMAYEDPDVAERPYDELTRNFFGASASGEVAAATCNGAGAEGVLTTAELTQLDDWLAEFGAVQILNRDRAVADGMTVALTLNGSGSAQPADDEKQALVSWAQSVYARIQP